MTSLADLPGLPGGKRGEPLKPLGNQPEPKKIETKPEVKPEPVKEPPKTTPSNAPKSATANTGSMSSLKNMPTLGKQSTSDSMDDSLDDSMDKKLSAIDKRIASLTGNNKCG